MRRLVVNADDLGADEARNRGILEAVRAGAVTSVSLLANGPAWEDALDRLRDLGGADVSVGVHLNLSEGAPVARGLRRLVGADGRFLGKAGARELLLRRGDGEVEREVEREMEAQILRLEDAGLALRHLDGHQHVHVFPGAVRPAMAGAAAHAIPWVRIPAESRPPGRGASDPLTEEARLFSMLAREARPLLGGCRAPERFLGLYWKGKPAADEMKKAFLQLSDGLAELMVHPGRAPSAPASGPFGGFSTRERELELDFLLSPAFSEILRAAGVELTPFPASEPCRPTAESCCT